MRFGTWNVMSLYMSGSGSATFCFEIMHGNWFQEECGACFKEMCSREQNNICGGHEQTFFILCSEAKIST